MITFLLDRVEHSIDDLDPNTTLLDYLREQLHKTGTKEGCASGDCGACTVVLAELVGPQSSLRYRAINACITPVATLHGKQLITVENLGSADALHPVQQAMVDGHGSQCGFCTPGFVMSMFAYHKTSPQPDRESINEALGGNLCRCTGYRPIIDAAVQMFETTEPDQFDRTEGETAAQLAAIQSRDAPVELHAGGKHYFAPATSAELADILLRHPQARLLAGGTDLGLELTQSLRDIDVLVYTGRVDGMTAITQTDTEVVIGAAVTYTDARDTLVALYPDLHELIDRLGSRQIRNQGTLGGNVANASPIGDMTPALIALDARLVLRRGNSSRVLAVEDYFLSYKVTALEPAEFIECIIVPHLPPAHAFRVYKISKRFEDDISATCGAFTLSVQEGVIRAARIAFGGMAEIPKRATHCEQALCNQPWSEATIATAMTALALDFQPISDFRSSADYRLEISQNLLQRLFLELQAPANPLRVSHHA